MLFEPQYPYSLQQLPAGDPMQVSPAWPPQNPKGETLLGKVYTLEEVLDPYPAGDDAELVTVVLPDVGSDEVPTYMLVAIEVDCEALAEVCVTYVTRSVSASSAIR